MTVAELFNEIGLSPQGPVRWKTSIAEPKGGVYVVALVGKADSSSRISADYLPPVEQQRWLPNEPIVYVGATECKEGLAGRTKQFYAHKYGKPSPHSGGQAVKLLQCDFWVYWSPATDPFDAEQRMLDAFKQRVGQLPFANRNSGRSLTRRTTASSSTESATTVEPQRRIPTPQRSRLRPPVRSFVKGDLRINEMGKNGISIDIPGFGQRHITTMLTDYTGTLSRKGRLVEGVKDSLRRLADLVDIHVITADTFGFAAEELKDVPVNFLLLTGEHHDVQKRDYGEKLSLEHCVVFGNGNNDRPLLAAAKASGGIAISVDNGEGCAIDAILRSHIFIVGAVNALNLLLVPDGCKATLRF